MAPKAVIIIPARYASVRYPGKPLAPLRGADGTIRPLIERSWRAACAVPGVDRVIIATDDMRIAEAAQAFGAETVMTPESCRNGTERCAAAIAALDIEPDVVVNLQGDAPLTPASLVGALLARMAEDPALPVCTPALTCGPSMLAALMADEAAGRVGGTTVVFGRDHDALYFSKRILPYIPADRLAETSGAVHLHAGVYAYRTVALATYAAMPVCPMEALEGLEQLRFLHGGVRVGLAVCAMPDWDLIELNNPSDVPAIEAILTARGIS